MTESRSYLQQVLQPPLREWRFWAIQASVVLIAVLHFTYDVDASSSQGLFPAGIPVALLILPVGYAGIRYGLAGSAATGLFATVLWFPDLLLPNDQGHWGADVVNLVLIDIVAFVLGSRIESERRSRDRADRATTERRVAEASYRQLFDSNVAPIFVLDASGVVIDANPAARRVVADGSPLHRGLAGLLDGRRSLSDLAGKVVSLPNGRDYRVEVSQLPATPDEITSQVVLEDVTSELDEGRRATRYAQRLVEAEEDQRRRLARELHDEPLQLFLHHARRLEQLGDVEGVPAQVVEGLAEIRDQAMEEASRLRSHARDLRPAVLDQLGLRPAVSSLLADVEESGDVATELQVTAAERRLGADVELGAFRIVQEAVRNAMRHGEARHIAVHLGFEDDELEVEVADDGVGFEVAASDLSATGHLGMVGMRERAAALGGACVITSKPGAGTTVAAKLPLRARD